MTTEIAAATVSRQLKLAARAQMDIAHFVPLASQPTLHQTDVTSTGAWGVGLYKVLRYYFVGDAVTSGQVQQVIAVAPNETIEIVTQTTRRISREDEIETTDEQERTESVETKDMLEISDVVSRTLSNSVTRSVSASVSGTVGVVSGSVSADEQVQSTDVSSTQRATKMVKELTTKSADRMKRSIRVRARNVQELTESNSSRRTITNPKDEPVNIAVKIALREETVIVQALDTQLCLRMVVEAPGSKLSNGESFQFPKSAAPIVIVDHFADISKYAGAKENPFFSKNGFQFTAEISLPPNHELDSPNIVLERVAVINGVNGQLFAEDGAYKTGARLTLNASSESKITLRYDLAPNKVEDYFADGAAFHLVVRLKLRISTSATNNAIISNANIEQQNLLARSSVRPRSAQVLREEERIGILSACAPQLRDILEAVDISDALNLEAAWYAFEEDDIPVIKDKAYLISEKTKPAPFGLSLGWQDDYVWEGDKLRNVFMRAKRAIVYLPVKPGYEDAVRDPVTEKELTSDRSMTKCERKPMPSEDIKLVCDVVKARNRAAIVWRDSTGDRIDPGDVPANTQSASNERLTELFNPKVYEDDNEMDPNVVYPILDRFKINTPVDGFYYEMLP